MHNNSYTFRFIIIVAGIAGLLLSLAANGLKERQEFNRILDTKKNILKTVNLYNDQMSLSEIENIYNQRIKKMFVSGKGDLNDVGSLPIYLSGKIGSPDAYLIPISGKGLWSTINGFFALKPDMNTVIGISFYEHGETPGLGGEIEKNWFVSQFKGKNIFNQKDELVSIKIHKGQVVTPSMHAVDGVSGATLTTKGVNDFLLQTLRKYEQFFRQYRRTLKDSA